MNTPSNSPIRSASFELRFESLWDAGRALVFPCDAAGQVDMDTLSARARDKYLCARALMGREFGYPKTCAALAH
jgi:hypothetical protein